MADVVLTPTGAALDAADSRLDEAWRAGTGVDEALAEVKALSRLVGRDPVIEDAKIIIARTNACTPSEAFEVLRVASHRTGRKLRDVAAAIAADTLP